MELNYEVYTLDFLELAILLVGKGINKIYGFPLDRVQIDSNEKMLQTLHKMVKRNIITSDGEAFHMNEPYEEMIGLLKEAKDVLIITPKTEELPMKCCYLGEKILICEISIIQKDTMKLCLIRKEDFIDFLDEGYLPKQLDKDNEWIEPFEDMENDLDDAKRLLSLDGSKLTEKDEVYFVLEKINIENKECSNRLIILEKPLNYQLVVGNMFVSMKSVYTFQNMKEQVDYILGEGKA
jgi:hypothetical protein